MLNRKRVIQLKIGAFSILCLGLFTISIMTPIRPTYSEEEKRNLEEFPAFSIHHLLDGEYFSGIDSWFADTFPGRDSLMNTHAWMKKLYGFSKQEIHGEIIEGGEIPEVPSTESSGSEEPSVTPEPTVEPTIQPESTTEPQPPEENSVEGLNTQALGALLIVGGSAYEYYNFNEEVSKKYAEVISSAATALKGTATVYDMIVPTSMDIVLPKKLREDLKTSDQKKAIDYMYYNMGNDVVKVPVYNEIKQHNNEYVYFRTDHHWTALGAYYAYEKFAAMKGFTATPVSEYQTMEFDGFLGSFYAESGKKPELKKKADSVIAYLPKSNATFSFTDTKDQTYSWKIVNDVSSYSSGTKYSAFIGGDNPYSIIKNQDIHDGSSIVVVKESYGNAFVPFLVDHYETVHVIDYRYYKGNLVDFVKKNGVQDVLFLNNIGMTRSKGLIGRLENILNQ